MNDYYFKFGGKVEDKRQLDLLNYAYSIYRGLGDSHTHSTLSNLTGNTLSTPIEGLDYFEAIP